MKRLENYNALKKLMETEKWIQIFDKNLVCSVCQKNLMYSPREGTLPVKKHAQTQIHTKNALLPSRQSQLNFKTITATELKIFI
jgi:hypothetical protein